MLEKESDEYKILEMLCRMPQPVRGMSEAMLVRSFKSTRPIRALAAKGLIRHRGWSDGPGGIWVPTDEGEAVVEDGEASG